QEQWEAHVACSCLRSSNPRTSHTDRPANSSRQRTSNEHHEFPGRLLLAWRSLDGLARPQRRLFCNPRVRQLVAAQPSALSQSVVKTRPELANPPTGVSSKQQSSPTN